MAGITATVLAATAVVGTGYSIRAQQQQASAQREALSFQREQADLQQANEKRNAIRAARIARGRASNQAALAGVSDSSGAKGGQASIASQLNYNLSFLDQQATLADQASASLGRARLWGARATMGQNVASVASGALPYSDDIGNFLGLNNSNSGG